jgi:hypothetical protein
VRIWRDASFIANSTPNVRIQSSGRSHQGF